MSQPELASAPEALPPVPSCPRDESQTTSYFSDKFTLRDPYHFLRHKEVKDHPMAKHTMPYIKSENAYYEATYRKPHKKLEDTLFEEIKSRIKDDDEGVPYRVNRTGGWEYYWKDPKGKEYTTYRRRKVGSGGPPGEDEIYLDINTHPLCGGLMPKPKFTSVGRPRVSPDETLCVFAVDHSGDHICDLFVKRLGVQGDEKDLIVASKKSSDVVAAAKKGGEELSGLSGCVLWGGDSRTIYYAVKDKAKRTCRMLRWKITLPEDIVEPEEEGEATPDTDAVVYDEKDNKFHVSGYVTMSCRFVMVTTSSDTSREVYYIPRDTPAAVPTLILPRREKTTYYVRHHERNFVIFHNSKDDEFINFRIVSFPVIRKAPLWDAPDVTEVVPYDETRYVMEVTTFKTFFVVVCREKGFEKVYVLIVESGEWFEVDLVEKNFSCWMKDNRIYDNHVFRLQYSSLVMPSCVIDYDVRTRSRKTLQIRMPEGVYDSSQYKSEVLWVPSRDGVAQIPVSLVYRPSAIPEWKSKPVKCLMYGYGAYSYCNDPCFDKRVVSLLDRGYVYVLAHTRGGADCGYKWYREGKMLKKKNTFYDFIDVGRFMCSSGWTSPELLVANGASAGGLLMGAILHMAPDLFRGIVLEVPFVDVINSMVDEDIPLTAGEWEEWGNPCKSEEDFEYMLSYSPYDRIEDMKGRIPSLFIVGSMNDSSVQYWEPVKFVAKIRHLVKIGQITSERVVCRVNVDSGHGGASGKYENVHEDAQTYSYIVSVLE